MDTLLPYLSLAGLLVVGGLVVLFLRTRQSDLLAEQMKKRQASSRLVTRGEFAEGMERMPVVLALTDTTFNYENADFEASIDLANVDEVEYDDELTTGRSVPGACRVLRLRSHGNAFDFILQPGDCQRWMAALPPHRMGESQLAAAQ